MKLKKIKNLDGLQVYQILEPSKAFKSKHPYKYICFLFDNRHNTVQVMEINEFPKNFAYLNVIGYIFTYASTIPMFIRSTIQYKSYLSAFPMGLDQYFPDESNNKNNSIDLIIQFIPKNKEVSPLFINHFIIRANSIKLCTTNLTISKGTKSSNIKLNDKDVLLDTINDDESNDNYDENETINVENSDNQTNNKTESTKTNKLHLLSGDVNIDKIFTKDMTKEERNKYITLISKNITSILNYIYKDTAFNSVEDWFERLCTIYPDNDNGLPVKYPNLITDSMFKNAGDVIIDKSSIHINYDFRASDYIQENQFITMLKVTDFFMN